MSETFSIDDALILRGMHETGGAYYIEIDCLAQDSMREGDYTDAQLLEMSIDKWQKIADLLEEGHRVMTASATGWNCPLCHAYQDSQTGLEEDECAGCPIKKQTGLPHCYDTPYHNAYLQLCGRSQYEYVVITKDNNLSRKEAEYLRELLDKEVQNDNTSNG